MLRPNLTKHPEKLAGPLYARRPWHGKLLVPFVCIALGLYALGWVVGLFV
jgi:hypothetical protein